MTYLPAVTVWAAGTFRAGAFIEIQDTATPRAGWVADGQPPCLSPSLLSLGRAEPRWGGGGGGEECEQLGGECVSWRNLSDGKQVAASGKLACVG